MIRIRHIVPFLCLVYASAAKSPSGKPKEEGAKGDDKSEDLPALQLEAQAMKDIRFFQMLKGTWTSTESAPVPEGSLMINTWKEIDRYECRLILKDSFLEISGTITKDSGVKLLEYQLTYRQDKESPHQFLYTYFNSRGYFGEGTVILDPGANTLTETRVSAEKTKTVTKYRFTDANTLVVSYVMTDAKGAVTYESVNTHKKEKKIPGGEANE